MKIAFHGAAQNITGSKHLITLENGKKILLDCGMFQGRGSETNYLNRSFGFDPAEVDYLVLSHAHIDHSGLIPRLFKEGYKGKVYCTPATFDLCKIMLMDSAHIQEADVQYVNKRKREFGKSLIEPLYVQEDVELCLSQFITIKYDKPYRLCKEVELLLTDNGHILGSAAVHLKIKEYEKTTHLTFTGDIGRYNSSLLKDPASFPQSDIIICESTYGDRLHDNQVHAEQEILNIIQETCQKKRGKVIIPAFSLGRTQEIVYSLNKLDLHGLFPEVNVYVDSPLAVNATEIMRKYKLSLNENVRSFIKSRTDPFGFDRLTYITDKRESQALNVSKQPAVIISASGMAEAGRIKHHLMNNIENPDNTILIVGYAEPNSLAGKLRNGDKQVTIFGMDFMVNASVRVIDSLSAHADYQEMIQYLSCQNPEMVKAFFLVHGDPDQQLGFKVHLEKAGFTNIDIPGKGQEYQLD